MKTAVFVSHTPKKESKMPRYGKVKFEVSYNVDLDNKDMVEFAKKDIVEYVRKDVPFHLYDAIVEIEDETATDIPSWLLDDVNDDVNEGK
jgi:hypothetical protein